MKSYIIKHNFLHLGHFLFSNPHLTTDEEYVASVKYVRERFRLSRRLAPAILQSKKETRIFESKLSYSTFLFPYVIPLGFKPKTFRTGI